MADKEVFKDGAGEADERCGGGMKEKEEMKENSFWYLTRRKQKFRLRRQASKES